MKLFIFRHGITYFSKNDIPYGDLIETAEILPEAVPTIKKVGEYLVEIPTNINFTSPYKRCLQTSEIVSGITGKKFEVDENLHDWDPRSETIQEMVERILKFSNKLQNNNVESVAICTHGYPINALIAYFTKGGIQQEDLENYPNPGVLVSIENGKVSFKDFNKS